MSPILHPTPVRTPEPVAPAVLPPPPKRRSSFRIWILLALIAGGAWVAYRFIVRPREQARVTQSITVRTAKVTMGAIQRLLRLTGSTTAKNFAMVTAPMMRGPDAGRALILIHVAKSGALVKKGDIVAQIDAQSMKDHVDDISAQIDQAESDIKKRKAEQGLNWENLQQNIRVTKAELDKTKLDLGAAE